MKVPVMTAFSSAMPKAVWDRTVGVSAYQKKPQAVNERQRKAQRQPAGVLNMQNQLKVHKRRGLMPVCSAQLPVSVSRQVETAVQRQELHGEHYKVGERRTLYT